VNEFLVVYLDSIDERLLDYPTCSGCGTTEERLHELTSGVWACDRCLEATLDRLRGSSDPPSP
jgi:ribosomal protein L37AE/L43A